MGGGYGSGAGWGEPPAGAWPAPEQYGAPPDPYGAEGRFYQPSQPSQPMRQYPPQQPHQPSQPMHPDQQYSPPGAYGGYAAYGAYGPQTFGGQQPYPMDEPDVSSRSPLTAVLIGGIVILLIAMTSGAALLVSRMHAAGANTRPIVGAAPTATATLAATPTPTVPPAFMTYTDPGGSYRLLVPTDWGTQTPQSSEMTATMFVSPDGTGAFMIARYISAANQSMFAANGTTFFSDYSTREGGPGIYTNLQGPSTISLAGEHWVQESADVPIRGGLTLHVVVLLANHASHAYLIAYIAEPTDFTRWNKKDFQPMEHSFTFL